MSFTNRTDDETRSTNAPDRLANLLEAVQLYFNSLITAIPRCSTECFTRRPACSMLTKESYSSNRSRASAAMLAPELRLRQESATRGRILSVDFLSPVRCYGKDPASSTPERLRRPSQVCIDRGWLANRVEDLAPRKAGHSCLTTHRCSKQNRNVNHRLT